MQLDREQRDEIVVLSFPAVLEIDIGNADTFKNILSATLLDGDRTVLLDLSAVGFFDSSGMGALLHAKKTIERRAGRLVLAGLNRPVQEVFRMVGFDTLFETYDDLESAIDRIVADREGA